MWNVGQDAIRSALRRRGYLRYITRSKPPLTEQHKLLRIELMKHTSAIAPVNKTHVTRKMANEEYNSTCMLRVKANGSLHESNTTK
ncbi:hypothetical protein K3495_g11785 [Podosphaera aphanis]|nr:hypothetical protein K3495_g11785 [Podosphaera aphanis]